MLRFLILLPFLVLLVAFALSNPQPVPLGLWPTDLSVEVPLSLAILAAAGLFFFLGALFVWFGTVAARTRHQRAERRASALEAELRSHVTPAPIVRGRARPDLARSDLVGRDGARTDLARPDLARPALAAPK